MPLSFLRRSAWLVVCCGAVAGIAGCGTSAADVTGTITFQGKSPNLKGLDIGFLGSNGRLVTAPVQADGTYKAAGVPAGEQKVCFIYTPPESAPGQGKPRMVRPGPNGPPPPPMGNPAQIYNPIPLPLREGSTSPLTFTVAPGSNNVFDYDIQP